MGPHYLDRFFTPQAIAVFGASKRSNAVGTRVYNNLLESGFAGPIYPINPKYKTLDDHDCYPDIQAIQKPIDLAVIATPAPTVPEILHTCGEHGVRAVIVISAGFSEGDGKGLAYERAALDVARQYQMRILGPNCLGLIRPSIGMNATFSNRAILPWFHNPALCVPPSLIGPQNMILAFPPLFHSETQLTLISVTFSITCHRTRKLKASCCM